VQIPSQIQAGDTITWRDDATVDNLGNPITSADYTLTYYLRTNTATDGATVVGTAYNSGWQFTLAAGSSIAFDAGTWYWQAVATKTGSTLTLGNKCWRLLTLLTVLDLNIENVVNFGDQVHPREYTEEQLRRRRIEVWDDWRT
jgi:Flp pilus assembly protein TadG